MLFKKPNTPIFLKENRNIKRKMQTAMDKVTLTSADGTTLKYGIPNDLANSGIKSIGNKSIKFMKKIHMNTVNESGAINLLFCLKILVTVP